MASFEKKVVLVTGVGRPGQIGHAVAGAFGRAGASLVIADREPQLVKDRAAELQKSGVPVVGVTGDLTTAAAARRRRSRRAEFQRTGCGGQRRRRFPGRRAAGGDHR